ncbi:MAG: porin [Proteobacteria bacterium]|nr:porin [Pseudomonadota bacterium]
MLRNIFGGALNTKHQVSLFRKIVIFIFLTSPQVAYSEVLSAKGFINFSTAFRKQNSALEQKTLPDGITKNRLNNTQSIGNDSQIFLSATEKLENGSKYGATAKTEFNFNSDGRNENPNLDQIFTFVEGDFGKFDLGNNQAVNQKMKSGPTRFARAAGGINGKYLEQINLPMLAGSGTAPHFILLAQSPIGHGGYAKSFYQADSAKYSGFNRSQFRALKDDSFDGVEDATKLSYYSPRMSGIQLGLSYAPSSSNIGFTKQIAQDLDSNSIKDIFSFGANYSEDFDNLGLEVSATAEKGKSKNSQRSDLSAYDLGTSLSYFGFTLGGSYGSWGSSLQPVEGAYAKNNNTNYRTLGIAYRFGPVATSITSLNTSFQKNNYSAISFGVDYKLTRSLMPYLELTKFSFDPANQGIQGNRGYVFLAGALYSF